MKFAVAVIARNEEQTLPRLVESLRKRGFTGNIYVLDTGSTDDTVEVARQLGCIVRFSKQHRYTLDKYLATKYNQRLADRYGIEDRQWLKAGDSYFDFASARNELADMVEEDWIFMPDCDEFVTENFNPSFFTSLMEKHPEINRFAYQFCYSRNPDGSPAYQFEHHKFYRKADWRWVGTVHEALVLERLGPVVTFDVSDTAVLLEHQQNPSTDRSNYVVGMLVDLVEDKIDIRTKHYLGRDLMNYSETHYKDLAWEILNEHASSPDAWYREAAESYLLMSTHPEFRSQEQILYAIGLDPLRREPWWYMVKYLIGTNRPHEARPFIHGFSAANDNSFYGSDQRKYTDDAEDDLLYLYYFYTGDTERSENILRKRIQKYGIEMYRNDLQFFPNLQNEFS